MQPRDHDMKKPATKANKLRMLYVTVSPKGYGVIKIKMPRWWKPGDYSDHERRMEYLHKKFGMYGWWRYSEKPIKAAKHPNAAGEPPATKTL